MPNTRTIEVIQQAIANRMLHKITLISADVPEISSEIAAALERAGLLAAADETVAVPQAPSQQPPAAQQSLSLLGQQKELPEFKNIDEIVSFIDMLVDDATGAAAAKPAGAAFLEDVAESAQSVGQTVIKLNRWTPKQEQAILNWRNAVDKWLQ